MYIYIHTYIDMYIYTYIYASGFGNLVLSMFGVQTLGLVVSRIPLMNHYLLLNMFQHPDPRQNWTAGILYQVVSFELHLFTPISLLILHYYSIFFTF
jgi:hypothetical protein